MPDLIHIREICAECIIGDLEWERTKRQPIQCDLSLTTDLSCVGASDALAETIDYAAVGTAVHQFIANSQFQMLEALAEGIATLVLTTFCPTALTVTLWKSAHFPGAQRVGIEITRP
jgi:7,8-dihydroneopterin aldolase/epimerase/oxygenase